MLIYGLGSALSRLISVFTAPILTWYFVPADYGAMALTQTVISCFILMLSFNLHSGIFRYFYEYETDSERSVVVSTGFLFYFVAGFVLGLIVWLSADLVEGLLTISSSGQSLPYPYAYYFQIMAYGVPSTLLNTHFMSVFRLRRMAWAYAAVNACQVVLNVGFVLFAVVVLKYGIDGVLFSGVLTSLIITLLALAILYRFYTFTFSFQILGSILSYCLPQFPAVVMNWSLAQSNRFFINYFSTLEHQGYYAIALKLASLLLLFVTAFRLAWDPFAMAQMKTENAKEFYARGYEFYSLLFVFIGASIALLSKPVLILLTPDTYWVAHSIVIFLIMAFVYQGANNILGIGISISKKTKFISYAQVSSLVVNISLNFILVPKYGAWGAAIAFLCGTIAQSISVYLFSQKVYEVDYKFFKIQVLNVLVFIYVVAFVYSVGDLDILYIIPCSLLSIIVLAVLILKLFVLDEDRLLLLSKMPWRRTD
ncbi:lipopolysaccharide biosynthesis protein [Malonomonas rubra]|uniref:lipopolysaccharide biosynthesis protein n=1 Tax=Malonomonas rubra TaxID=57040 RepID=UPI001379C666|nr:polysaccharide biosynthesis C-terminal domain-containing protein [Malonomonas rubra]